MTDRFRSLDNLPLFASDDALAVALIGCGKIEEFRALIPLLERRGVPTVDATMGGRYVPAVRRFFDREYSVTGESQVRAPHQPAKLGTWKATKKARRG